MVKVSASVALMLVSVVAVAAQSREAALSQGQSETALKTEAVGADGARRLDEDEKRLVQSSKAALLAAGMSEDYFDRHFKLLRVMNKPSDRRVVWLFKVNEYEALVNDTVGFYADERGRHVYTHSIANSIGEARDIKRTISRRRAERIMRRCIGEFQNESVAYQSFGPEGRAALVFTAISLPSADSTTKAKTGSVAPPSSSTPPAKEDGNPYDYVKPGGKKKPFLLTGSVNLETGRCTKGVAQYGAPPAPPSPK